jgi:hypothetical protein
MGKFNFSFLSSIVRNLPNYIVIALLIWGGLFAFKEFKAFSTKFGLDLDGIRDARFDEQQRRIDELNRRYLQLDVNIARAQTNIVSAEDIERMFKETIDPKVQEIVEKNKEEVTALGKAIAVLERSIQKDVTPHGEYKFVSPDGVPITIENLYVYADSQDTERGIRLAQVVFDFSDTTFTPVTDALEIHTKSVRTQQPTGNFNHYVEVEAYNRSDQIYKRKPYKLRVDSLRFEERKLTTNRWFLPEPHLEGGFGSCFLIGRRTFGFDIGVSLAAYGRTAHDNYLRFARLGVGVTDDTDKLFGSFSPIGVNVRAIGVPFLKDTWIFPGMSLRKGGDVGLSASLSTTF